MTYGRLTVLDLPTGHVGGRPALLCRCECGTEVAVQRKRLFSGHTQSCGCLQKQRSAENLERKQIEARTHGLTRSKEWKAWMSMKSRVGHHHPKAEQYYRCKGVTIAPEWQNDFEAFLAYVGNAPSSEHSIDRIRGDGNYEPGNVKWSTVVEQNRNKSDNVWVDVDGEPRLLVELASERGIPYQTLNWRLQRAKWPVERALSEPVRGHHR